LVVDKFYLFQAKTFFVVQVLLFFQDTLVEKLLQFFVAVVDAKLFEAVHGKVFLLKDIAGLGKNPKGKQVNLQITYRNQQCPKCQ
jgi:hypothetical protein